ncbi:hypothetical protein LE181_18290 [Streptomyces sp. SCA3-4]|uniref:hypothetical protein n=1 Tax=Streptomyces sichuanensis TaxID=2871810 RepID=UPI001CE33AF6|nr:hypothetical protein [Streptomyces sichuanensis]MCA6094104.1 hypothetical protein [Streptomyces sichuanensis]
MRVPELLESAGLLAAEAAATDNDVTVADVWDYLVNDEWDTALDLLEDLGDGRPPPPAFWEAMAEAAEELRMERSAAWCRWRCFEARNGVMRADLTLSPAGATRRTTPVPGAGVLRPMWNIGHHSPTGGPSWSVAALWIEGRPSLPPGGRAPVRLFPLTPAHWRHLRPGDRITMHEDRSVAGTATILEVRSPVAASAARR